MKTKTKAVKIQIVLAWKTIEQRLVRPGRTDLGERSEWTDVETPHAAVWLRRGDASDVEKATVHAATEKYAAIGLVGKVHVFTYPTSEEDPLGRARREVMKKEPRR